MSIATSASRAGGARTEAVSAGRFSQIWRPAWTATMHGRIGPGSGWQRVNVRSSLEQLGGGSSPTRIITAKVHDARMAWKALRLTVDVLQAMPARASALVPSQGYVHPGSQPRRGPRRVLRFVTIRSGCTYVSDVRACKRFTKRTKHKPPGIRTFSLGGLVGV